MADPARKLAGFASMDRGMDGGRSPSLIPVNAAALMVNMTVRDSYPKTRPPFERISFSSADVAARWNGRFQGHAPYDGGLSGQGGWIISRGGKLFFLTNDTFVLREITPRIGVSVTADFVPGAHIFVNDVGEFTVGDNITIDGGSYTIDAIFTNEIAVTYNGGSLHNPVPQGAVVESGGVPITVWEPNPDTFDFVFIFQAETFGIILCQEHDTIIFDGRQCRRALVNEVPPGILGAYGWGRIWICLSDRRSFVAGDLVSSITGTVNDILGFTENTFLSEGGAFAVPANAGLITGMQFLATQDTSLGVGVLLVSTTNMVFSVNAPVDRSTWKNLTYPIQTISLLDYGPQGPLNAVPVNGDMWYRSADGVRSFVVARRDFGVPGNVPLSQEVIPIIEDDTEDLLFFGSGVLFDNRLLLTASPLRNPIGVAHRGLVVVNYDELSTLGSKSQPAWEGAWTGLDILQISKCTIKGVERCFMFVLGDDIEFWELKTDGIPDINFATRTPIAQVLETRSEDYQNGLVIKGLHMAEMYLDEIADNVQIVIKFRPDQYPLWTTWGTLNFCADVSQCAFTSTINGQLCSTWKQKAKQYAARVTLGRPPEGCNAIQKNPLDQAYEFQFRFEITGSVRIRRFFTHTYIREQEMEGGCPGEVACTGFDDCGTAIFGLYNSHGA